jgi:hypothetical protein
MLWFFESFFPVVWIACIGYWRIAVPRASFESMQLQEFANGTKVTSVRAGCRQVIAVYGDYSRELL